MVQQIKQHAPRLVETVLLIIAMILVQAFQPPRPCHCTQRRQQRQEISQGEPADPPPGPAGEAAHGPP